MGQAKGSASRIVVDWESSFGVPKESGLTGKILPFNSCDLKMTRALNESETLRGNRNPSAPFTGNKDISGNLVVPVLSEAFGWALKAAIGTPTTTEYPLAATAGSDIKTGSPTLTIAGDSGGYTFSVAQTSYAVGDRVIYESGGTRYTGYITTKTNTTTGVLSKDRAGTVPCVNVASATVIAVCDALTAATPGTVTISSGAATFSEAQADLAAGQMLIYDYAGTPKFAWVGTVTDTTHCTLTTAYGVAPADVTTKSVEWLGKASMWRHVYKIHATNSLPSFVVEKGFLDLTSAYYELFKGCKANSMELTAGGDGELLATIAIMGADMDSGTSAYDSSALDLSGNKYQMFHAAATEGGSAISVLREFKLNLNNNLDGDTFVIGGAGVRTDLPEGIAQVTGALNALFTDTSLLAKATGDTESSLTLTFTNGVYSVAFSLPELVYSPNSPAIIGPKGILLDLDYGAYYNNDAAASALTATVINYTGAY